MGSITGKTWTDYSEPRIMAADLEAIEAAAASTIVGAGRPDIPATLTTPGTAALVAAATSGTVFRSVDGPQGAWEWQKQGSAWRVLSGDTGTVNSPPSEDHWTVDTPAGRFAFRRFGRVVNFNARIASVGTTPAGSRIPIGAIPVGFQPPSFAGSNLLPGGIYGLNGSIFSRVGSLLFSPTDWVIEAVFPNEAPDIEVGDNVLVSGTWLTTNLWPTLTV